MAVAIVATVGSATANSFVTLAEAQTYMDGRLNGTLWDSATTDSQNRALVEAARELNTLSFVARKTTNTQALQWPRFYATDPDAALFTQWFFAATVIPQRVKDAQCELALEFLKAGTTDVAALDPTIAVKEKAIDVIRTIYVDTPFRKKGLQRFPRVWHLIAPLLDQLPGNFSIVRG